MRATGAGIVVAGLIALGGCSGTTASTPREAPGASVASNLASTINTIGTAQFADGFAGAEKLPNGQVVVYVVPGQDASFLALLPPVTHRPWGPSYVTKPVTNSWAAMNLITQAIAGDSASLRAAGTGLATWGPDIQHNKVLIVMQHYDAAKAEQLVNRYGANLVEVSTNSMPQSPAPAH